MISPFNKKHLPQSLSQTANPCLKSCSVHPAEDTVHASRICFSCEHEWRRRKHACERKEAVGFCYAALPDASHPARDPCRITHESVRRPLIRRGLINYWFPPSLSLPARALLTIYIPFKSGSLKRDTKRWMLVRWRPIRVFQDLRLLSLHLLIIKLPYAEAGSMANPSPRVSHQTVNEQGPCRETASQFSSNCESPEPRFNQQ